MSAPSEFVRLVVGGQVLDTWTEYRFTEDLFTPANDFEFRLHLSARGARNSDEYLERVLELTRPDVVVRLELVEDTAASLLAIGIVDNQFIGGDIGHEYVEVSGRDPAQVLLDNEVSLELRKKVNKNVTLPEIVDEILKRYRGKGIPFGVKSSNAANRQLLTGTARSLSGSKKVRTSKGAATAKFSDKAPPEFVKMTIADANPHPGETEWDFIHRHAQNLGVIPMMSAEGDLILTAPDYDQVESFHLYRSREQQRAASNNILSGGRRLNHASMATSVHVLGRGSLYHSADPRVKTPRRQKKKAAIQAEAKTDRPFVWPRERFIRDSNPKNNDAAMRTARRELAHRNANVEVYEYTVPGHRSDTGQRYAADTMGHVYDELPRPTVNAAVYVTKRTISKKLAKENATTTMLTMVPKGAIVL